MKPVFVPYGYPEPDSSMLEPTDFLDFGHPTVASFVERVVGDETDPVQMAIRLFYAVRDEIRYDSFAIRMQPDLFQASHVLTQGRAFCIPKAVLLAAGARACAIPTLIGLSDVVNHFTTPKVEAAMGGCNVFLHHGYAVMYLEGRWVKAAPAFNGSMCERFGVSPTEFDGTSDAILQEYDREKNLRMEYLKNHGLWNDLPFTRIREDFESYYPSKFYNAEMQRTSGR